MDNKFVLFNLCDELYALPIFSVERILSEQAITKIPRTPKMFLGVFDLRGETVPAVDLRQRLEMENNDGPSNYVVAQTPSGRCALRVDSLAGIKEISDSDISEGTEIISRKDDAFITGIAKIDERLAVILNVDELIPKKVRGLVERSA